MQSFSAASTRPAGPRLLVVELWGLGDVALALPFLQAAARQARVTLLARPQVAPLVRRICPEVEAISCLAPWTAHRGKYRLHRWPWRELGTLLATLRAREFSAAVSARADPRDHLLMALASAGGRAGFPRAGSALLLTDRLAPPENPHRSAAWAALAQHLGFSLTPPPVAAPRPAQNIIIHTGAAQPTRIWPRDRFEAIGTRLRASGRSVTILDGTSGGLDELTAALATADRFIGNDSGPGHVAALLGIPTFTIGGSYPMAQFHPAHPAAAWIERACPHKPCRDFCHYEQPHCIVDTAVEEVWSRLQPWLA